MVERLLIPDYYGTNRGVFWKRGLFRKLDFLEILESLFTAHSSTPTPVFLTSLEETQTMVRAQLGPKLRPPQTLYFSGKGETQTMV